MSEFGKTLRKHNVFDRTLKTDDPKKILINIFQNWKSPEDYERLQKSLSRKNEILSLKKVALDNFKKERTELRQEIEKLKADKQLVVVPKFVDDAIRSLSNGYRSAFDAIYLIKGKVEQYNETNSDWIEVYDWIFEGGNSGIFERAFLDGYTVEKEKLYRVVFLKLEDDDEHLLFKSGDDYFFDLATNQDGYWKQHFTEKEIKTIDERYWAFAVPVDEVTE